MNYTITFELIGYSAAQIKKIQEFINQRPDLPECEVIKQDGEKTITFHARTREEWIRSRQFWVQKSLLDDVANGKINLKQSQSGVLE